MGLSERELGEIEQRHTPDRAVPSDNVGDHYCTMCSNLRAVAWPCDAVRLVAEVRRLRTLWSHDETDKYWTHPRDQDCGVPFDHIHYGRNLTLRAPCVGLEPVEERDSSGGR